MRYVLLPTGLLILLGFLTTTPVIAQTPSYNLEFATYLGGSQFDRAQGVGVDENGYIYVCINTHLSTDLPTTPGAYDRTPNGGGADGYIAKLTPDGKQLVWATYLGGSNWDRCYTVKVDQAGYVYASVWTGSADYPTTEGAFDRQLNNNGVNSSDGDIAITKLTPDGSSLVYSTFLGGSKGDQSRNALDVDDQGYVYLAGVTRSSDFPVKNAFRPTFGGGLNDAFVAKITPDGSALHFSTFLGGSSYDSANSGVIAHSDGTIFVTGQSRSVDFPVTTGAHQTIYAGCSCPNQYNTGDAFVARLNQDGSLIYSTFVGGSDDDGASYNDALAVDSLGQAVVFIDTKSLDFPTTSGIYQGSYAGGTGDTAITKISADGTTLVASTYLGGSTFEEASGIDVDSNGNVYISGNTNSNDWPVTMDAVQTTFGGVGSDAMISMLSSDLTQLLYSTYYGGTGTHGERGRELVLDTQENIILSGDTDSSDFPVINGSFDTTYHGSGDGFVIKFYAGSAVNPTPTNALTPTQPPPSPTSSPIPGDHDNDGDVDIYDYLLLVSNFTSHTIFTFNLIIRYL